MLFFVFVDVHWGDADIAQLVERIHGKDEVSGPNPDVGSRNRRFLVES